MRNEGVITKDVLRRRAALYEMFEQIDATTGFCKAQLVTMDQQGL